MRSIYFLRPASFIFAVILSICFTSCKNDDPPLPDNVAVFEAAVLGVAETDTELAIKVRLTRAVDKATTVSITYTADGAVEGTDFTISPAGTSGVVSVTIPVASNEATLTLAKVAGVLLDGDEKITFTLTGATAPVILGDQKSLVVSFSEILSTGSAFVLNGGGATYSSKVFVDLSANTQTPVLRTSWDLGFYMGTGFNVIVNSSTAMMARVIDKTDLTTVTAADTLGFASAMSISAFNSDAIAWVDDPSGDLSKTAFAEISATDSENKVYIINRGNGIGSPAPNLGWKKVRVIRNGTGYTVQYADINAIAFSELQVTKDDTYNFKYIHFGNGEVSVEPAAAKWDIAWTYFVNVIPNGPSNIPYGFQDVVIQNRNNVQTAKVLTSAVAYADFSAANIAALTFSTSQLNIGSDWRVTSPPPAAVYADRFYVIKDPAGNYYKLKFTALLIDGVRGTPALEYALVKKGE